MAVIKVSDLPQKETLDSDDKIVGYSDATGGTSLLLGQAFIDIQTAAETSATAAAKSASTAKEAQTATDAIATDAQSTITSLKSDALDAINSEKTESVSAVQVATKTAESAINASKTSAVSSVRGAQETAEESIKSARESALSDIANAKLLFASEEEAKAGTEATKAISPATLTSVLSAKFVASTTDLEDGVSELADGTVYFVYEE